MSKINPTRLNIVLFFTTLFLLLLIPWNPPKWKYFADPYDYLKQSEYSLINKDFYAPQQSGDFDPRPFTVPLFYKIAASNPDSIIILQKIIHSLAAFLLVFCLLPLFNRKTIQYIFVSFAYILMSWWNIVGWTHMILSESLTISLFVCWISSFILILRHPRKLFLVIHIILAILFSFTRDSWPYLILVFYLLMLTYALIYKKIYLKKTFILLFSLSILVFWVQQETSKIGVRTKIPAFNTFVLRILPNEEYTKWFVDRGMPDVKLLRDSLSNIQPNNESCIKLFKAYSDSTYKNYFNWIIKESKPLYIKFLITHPTYSLLLLDQSKEQINRIFVYNLFAYTGGPEGFTRISHALLPIFNVYIVLVLLILLFIKFLRKKVDYYIVPIILFLVFVFNTLLMYNADCMEVERHMFINSIVLQLIGIITSLLLLDDLNWMNIKETMAKNSFVKNKIGNKLWLKSKMPFWVSMIIVLFILNLVKNVEQWKTEEAVINWDVVSYYGYLPAVFIYHDYTLEFKDTYKGPHKFTIWSYKSPIGKNVIITSMGMSMLYMPFFLCGHAAALMMGYDAGGYSEPYRLALILSSVFYLALGLFFLSRILLRYFSPGISAFVVFLTVIGTNLFFYVTYSSAMSHPYNFALITMFIWYTIRWYESDKIKHLVILGILLGLISLVRPTNIIIALFFILWDVKKWVDLKDRILFFLNKWKNLLIFPLCIFLIWLPQMLYWKSVAGSFMYYSYGDDQRFFFLKPHILGGLFGYRHGLIMYSPAMIFSFIGMFFLWKNYKSIQIPLITTFLVFIYVIFSWWCWWYGGAFGMRAMIDIFGLMAIPTAAFFTYVVKWKNIIRIPIIVLSVILILVSVHHTNKHRHFSIHWDANTKASFWDSYFSLNPTDSYLKKLRSPDYNKAKQGIEAYAVQ